MSGHTTVTARGLVRPDDRSMPDNLSVSSLRRPWNARVAIVTYKECGRDTFDVARTYHAHSVIPCFSDRVFGAGGCMTLVFDLQKSSQGLKFLVNRSSLLRCAPGSRTPPGGNPSSASSELSLGIKNNGPNESFSYFRDNRELGLQLFTGAGYADSVGMTIEKCATFCDSQSVPYRFMGITDGYECCMSTPTTKDITDFADILSMRQLLRGYFRERERE